MPRRLLSSIQAYIIPIVMLKLSPHLVAVEIDTPRRSECHIVAGD